MNSSAKIFKLLLSTMIVLFTFSCGSGNNLEAKDVSGIWKAENAKLETNSCNLPKSFIKLDSFSFKIKDDKEKIIFLICEDDSCEKNEKIGEYVDFNETIKITHSFMSDFWEDRTQDCKIKSEAVDEFTFSSKNSGNIKTKVINKIEGKDCNTLKELLKENKKENSKEFIEILDKGKCEVSFSAKIKKQ